jgi:hypothetical protein
LYKPLNNLIMKKTFTKIGVIVSATILLTNNMDAQWALTGNTITALQTNTFGTAAASAATRRSVNIITNGVLRSVIDGAIYNTTYQGVGTNNILSLNTNNSNIAIVRAGRNLGLFAGTGNCETTPFAPGDIIAAGRNMFLQSKDAIIGGFLPQTPPRVFIGEFSTFTPTVSTPKLLVRGGGTFTGDVNCGVPPFNDADNIGLVSLGNFGESPTSANPTKWLALGNRPSATIGFNTYGFRSQWNNYAVDLAVQEQAAGTIKDATLTWQDGLTTTTPSLTAFSSANSLLIQFRNGNVPSADPNLSRRTVAKYSVAGGNGFLEVSGTVMQNASLNASDSRLKKDVKRLTNSMDIIKQLNPVTYNYKTDEFSELGLPRSFQYGFIAQELEKVLPTHVETASSGYKAVNYVMLIPILTKALQESDVKLNTMETKLTALTEQNQKLNEQLERKGIISSEDKTSNDLRSQFYQNKPNPFNESTTISYNFKNDEVYKIVVTDLTGKAIKQFTNLQGTGDLKISKEDLPATGIYLYSLITSSGDIAGTKQMIFEK